MTFRYGAHDTPLYEHFSARIAPGERVGLVGHSGSGKTTFIKLIQRLYDVNEGRILIDGQDIAQAQQASLRRQIAIVQQEPILFHRTLAENIAYGRPGATQAEIEHAARQASAHDFIMRLPKGYDTMVGERGVKLSGGERQRVAIARAFLADAPILILDEATSSLDSESEVLIQQAMERLMEGRSTLVVAHRLSTVRALDRLLVMDHGRVIEEGNHETLIRRPGGVYRRLFERQALELTRGCRWRSCAATRRASSTNPRTATWRWIRAEAAWRRPPAAVGARRRQPLARTGGRYQAGRSANVRRRPKPISAVPKTRLWIFCAFGLADSQRPIAPPASAHSTSNASPRLTRITPSTANCRPTGPLAGDTNCGSSTEQNSKALGLSTLVSTPDISAPRQLVVFAASAAPRLVGHGTGAQQLHPSHIR